MNAALAYDTANYPATALAPALALALPDQLRVLFEESPKMKASFWRLNDRDRRGFLRYVDEAKSTSIRERRAAIVAMSLIGLARDLPDDGPHAR